jgi:hypothetical protein
MGSHSKPRNRTGVTKVVGLAGMATTAAVMGLSAGAGTAQAVPGPCSNCVVAPPGGSAFPTGFTMPQYGNIQYTLPQSGLGRNPQTCSTGGGAGCFQPIATTFFPISGQSYTSGSFPTGNPAAPTQTCTAAAPCTIPATANNEFPVVANANGTGTTFQLPVFSFF